VALVIACNGWVVLGWIVVGQLALVGAFVFGWIVYDVGYDRGKKAQQIYAEQQRILIEAGRERQ
jgi:hypothetical protein